MDENYADAPKVIIPSLQKKEMFEVKNDYKPETDEDTVKNLGIWKRRFKMADSINKSSDFRLKQLESFGSPKDKSPINIRENLSISDKSRGKKEASENNEFKGNSRPDSRKDQFDDLLSLPLINYKNQDSILRFSEDFGEETYDLENISKQISILFKCKPDFSTLMQNALFYERFTNAIQDKILKRMKDVEAILVSKTKNIQTLRMENCRINEKKNKIQSLVSFINFKTTTPV